MTAAHETLRISRDWLERFVALGWRYNGFSFGVGPRDPISIEWVGGELVYPKGWSMEEAL